MNKTSMHQPFEESTRLAALPQLEGTSQAEVIRRAIKNYEPERRGDRHFALAGWPKVTEVRSLHSLTRI